MSDLVNARLVQGIDLRLAVKQAHWNLRGRGYIGVHELLDEVSARIGEGTDMMAERVALMGGLIHFAVRGAGSFSLDRRSASVRRRAG